MIFFNHPNKVGMTYFQHMKFSYRLSLLFFEGFYKALIHSFIPDIYITSSTNISKDIQDIINNVHLLHSN